MSIDNKGPLCVCAHVHVCICVSTGMWRTEVDTACFLNYSPLIYLYLVGKTLSEPTSCQLSRTGWPGIPRDSHRISTVPTELLARLQCSIFTEEGIQIQRGQVTQGQTSNPTQTNGTFNLVYLERVGKRKEKIMHAIWNVYIFRISSSFSV